MTLPLLFLSGAGLPAWVWDDVRRRPPVDSRVADRPRGRVGLADCAEAARAAEADWPAYGVVAHSIGAVVAAALVTQDADRVHAVIGVCGIVPRPDASFIASLPMPQRWMTGAIIRVVGTKPPDSTIRSGQCHGLDDAAADRSWPTSHRSRATSTSTLPRRAAGPPMCPTWRPPGTPSFRSTSNGGTPLSWVRRRRPCPLGTSRCSRTRPRWPP